MRGKLRQDALVATTKKKQPASGQSSKPRALRLTAAYVEDRSGASEHRVFVEVLEADGVFTEGKTVEDARKSLHKLIPVMLEEAPQQFRRKARATPPGALCETFYVLLP